MASGQIYTRSRIKRIAKYSSWCLLTRLALAILPHIFWRRGVRPFSPVHAMAARQLGPRMVHDHAVWCHAAVWIGHVPG